MPKSSKVATELRKLADALDKEPEAKIACPSMYFTSWDEKEEFLAVARLLPRPYRKNYTDSAVSQLQLVYETASLCVKVAINRDVVCRIAEPAQPAVYECEPLLSLEEESVLTGAK